MRTACHRRRHLSPPALGDAHRWKVLAVGVAANATFSAAASGMPTTAIWLRSGLT
jgi:hypothetical protein